MEFYIFSFRNGSLGIQRGIRSSCLLPSLVLGKFITDFIVVQLFVKATELYKSVGDVTAC